MRLLDQNAHQINTSIHSLKCDRELMCVENTDPCVCTHESHGVGHAHRAVYTFQRLGSRYLRDSTGIHVSQLLIDRL